MTVQRLQAHYGFTRMPFGRNLAPGMLHRYTGHGEAVARISWCVDQHAVGVITGEVGAGKTVAVRAATAALDTSRHVVIYLPNPSVGVRGMLHHIVSALGQVPSFYTATLAPQAADALAAEHAERGRTPVVVIDFSAWFLRVVHPRWPNPLTSTPEPLSLTRISLRPRVLCSASAWRRCAGRRSGRPRATPTWTCY